MRTTLCFVLAFGACTSLALAESLPPPGSAAGEPVALTEAEMDGVTAGVVPVDQISLNYEQIKVTYGKSTRTGSYGDPNQSVPGAYTTRR